MLCSRFLTVKNALIACGLIAVGGYLLHLAGPLRLVDDAPVYLNEAGQLAQHSPRQDRTLPLGFPLAIATLVTLGTHSSAAIVGLNIACAAVGILCCRFVLINQWALSKRAATICVLLPCYSICWIYLVPVPMSDMLFFGLASVILAALTEAGDRLRPQLLILAAVALSVAAFAVRTIGCLLFVVTIYQILDRAVASGRLTRRQVGALALVGGPFVVLAALIARPFWVPSAYQIVWARPSVRGDVMLEWRTSELGQLFQNVSASAFHPHANVLPIETTSWHELLGGEFAALSYVAGAVAIGLILLGLWKVGRLTFLHVYLIGYTAVLSVWPYPDLRFWAPLLPFLFGAAWLGWSRAASRPVVRFRAVTAYCLVFWIFGTIAMTHSLYVSLIDRQRTEQISRQWILGRPDWKAARLFLD